MSEDVTVRCDAPDCDAWAGPTPDPRPLPDWFRLVENAGPTRRTFDFHSIDCVLRFAGRIPAPESIPLNREDL